MSDTQATKDVLHEARTYITRLRSDAAFDGGCTNSYDLSLLGSLCSEIERLRAKLKTIAYITCEKECPPMAALLEIAKELDADG